jgi:thiamine transport system substrate-binding protein
MKRSLFLLILLGLLASACSLQLFNEPTHRPAGLTVITHDSFAISEQVVGEFENKTNVKVTFLAGGDAGEALNKVILSKGAPLADVFFGVDNTFLSRALEAGIFEEYESPALAGIPDEFKLDEGNRALPVDYGDVCINYDKAYFVEKNLRVPQRLEELTSPEYRDLLVVENPATSSPGLAFLLATRAHFGDGYLDYWRALKENGVVVVDGWETAYYTNFSGSSGHGPQPMVVSYATSPAAEVIFAETPLGDAPTASVLGPGTCFRQIEFAGILKGTRQRPLAEAFVDFMLSRQFQQDVPLQMFMYPVNREAQLPEAFVLYAPAAGQPASLSPDEIAANRDQWIDAWTQTVLK